MTSRLYQGNTEKGVIVILSKLQATTLSIVLDYDSSYLVSHSWAFLGLKLYKMQYQSVWAECPEGSANCTIQRDF